MDVANRSQSIRRLLWRLETPVGLTMLLVAGLVLRVALAPHLGFAGDLNLFRQWTGRLAAVGPHSFYAKGQFADYPPGYLYILWIIGKLTASPGYVALKLPAIAADLG